MVFQNLLHFGETAHVEQPFVNEVRDINAVAGRCVVHRAVIGLTLPVEHYRSCGTRIAEKIFADNYNSESCGSHVLLSSGIEHTELCDIDRLAQYAG